MNISQYQTEIKQFIKYTQFLELHYLIPALRREVDEWTDTTNNPNEEILEMGDCLFMVARILYHYDVPLDDTIPSLPSTLHDIRRAASKMLDCWVKVVRDHDGVVNERNRAIIVDSAINIVCYLKRQAAQRGMTLDELAELNVRKLKARHMPEGAETA